MSAWIIYAAELLLTLYVNRFIYCMRLDKPVFLLNETNFVIVYFSRIVISYGSIGLIWWQYNLSIFAITAIAYVLFNISTRRFFLYRYINYLTAEYKDIVLEKAKEEGRELTEEQALSEANKSAKEHIALSIKYGL